jgi:hypothetical protein
MKVFSDPAKALTSLESKESYYLNSTCPYNPDGRLCGSYCALFYLEHATYVDEVKKTSAFVILGCKAGEKYLYVNEFVED